MTGKMSETQLRLANIWGSILPDRTARMLVPQSNFFDEGGHSILAQQMFSSVRKEWQDINIPVGIIFQAPTLEGLAAEIDRARDPIGLRLDTMPLSGDEDVADEAYAADARAQVQNLPKSFSSVATDEGLKAGSPCVLLTGATGFLGSYILRELLDGPTKATVIALVRAKDKASGLERLQNTLKLYGLWKPSWMGSSRLDIVLGDISQSNLGLTQDSWQKLGETVHTVIHNGAQVNWMRPYSQLRAANVLSTIACIQLCAFGKAKRLAFVSSTSTLDNEHFIRQYQDKRLNVLESDDLEGSRKGLGTGYGQSKWASEYLVREAGKRGLTGAIIRPGYITGDPQSGISITDDFLIRLWKGSLQVGARPDIANSVNTVPVSQVSRIVVAATFHLPTVSGRSLSVAQVTSHPRLTLNQWIGTMEAYGYRLPQVPYPKWSEKVRAYVETGSQKEEHALLPLYHFVTGDLPANTIAPELDDKNAMAALGSYEQKVTNGDMNGHINGDHRHSANAVNEETIGMYLAYLVATGFLPAPTEQGAKALPKLKQEHVEAWAAGRPAGRSAVP